MSRWLRGLFLLWLTTGCWGCSTPNPNVRVRHMPDGRLQVDGPLAGPFKTSEELAASACELMTRQPGASNGLHGFEYCALHYYSSTENAFFLSYLSDIGGSKGGGKKYCRLPMLLDDPNHEDAIILGGAHSHPHNRRFSREDLSVDSHWRPTRLLDKQDRADLRPRAAAPLQGEDRRVQGLWLQQHDARGLGASRRPVGSHWPGL